MLFKVGMLTVLFFTLIFVQGLVSTAIQPEVATNIALEQFADPSTSVDTASRAIDRYAGMLWGLAWFTYLVVAIGWLRKDIVAGCKKLAGNSTSQEEEGQDEEL